MTRSPAVDAKPSSRLSVYDFHEDDQPLQTAYKWINRRSNNRKQPKRQASPITKYDFLQYFVGGKETVNVDNKEPPQKKGSFEPIGVDDEPVQTCSAVVEGLDGLSMDIKAGTIGNAGDQGYHQVHHPLDAPEKDHVVEDTTPLVLSSDSDDEVDMQLLEASTSTSPEKEDLSNNQVLELGSAGHKIDSINSTVVVFPDYVCYGDVYCTSSQLTFSCHCVKVEAPSINGTTGIHNAEWAVNDIVSFQSQWSERVESALVKLQFRSKTSTGSGDGYETSGTESLKFAAYDPHWSEGLEAIKSLNVQYANVWSSTSVEEDEDGSFKRIRSSNSQTSFSRLMLDGNYKEVVYPIDDPDAVLISTRDLALLQPETFINDTIIDFYVKYLINNKIRQEDQNRFHFFNCFFFRKLADLDEHLPSVREGEVAFQSVYKWTKKLDLFKKDYLFIPVNYSLHWSLIVICHPGEVVVPKDDGREKLAKIPCILHMDSIQGSHKGLKNLFQSYLAEEWKVRHQDMVDDVSSKFSDLRFIQLELPQQSNSFDCGLFLLHYLELFLEETPANFNPSNLSDFSNFLNKNWFPPDEACLKRRHIQKLLSEVLMLDSIQRHPCSENCDALNEDIVVEVLGEQLVSSEIRLANALISDTELSTGNSPVVTSPTGGSVDRIGDMEIEVCTLSEPGTSSRSLYDEILMYQRKQMHYSITLSPVKEMEECVLATEGCYPETQESELATEDCFRETQECVMATVDCFRETQECMMATEDCFPETPECMLATQDCLLETGKSPTPTMIPFVGKFTSPGAPRKQKDVHVEQLSYYKSPDTAMYEDDLQSAYEQSQHHKETRKLEFLSASSHKPETYVIEDSEEENSE